MSVTTNEGTTVIKTQEQTIYLDLMPGGLPPVAHVSQNDTAARVLVFRIMDNGALVTTKDLSAMMRCLKPDGAYFSCSCTVGEYLIACPCYAQMTACPGQVKCEIQLTTSSGQISTANFILDVEKDPAADATSSITVVSDFQDLAAQASASATAAASSATESAASATAAAQSATSVANAYRYNYVSTTNTDLDDYTSTGYYYFSSSYTPANVPDSSTSGLLFVTALTNGMSSSLYLKQIWYRQGDGYTWRMYTRLRNDSGWTSWYQYLTASDVTGTASTAITNTLTANRALITNSSGNMAASSVTQSELYQLTGLDTTQTLQTQLNTHTTNIATNATNITKVMPTMSTAVSNLGSDSVSVPTGTFTNLGSITLTAGLWIVTFTTRWSNTGTRGGYRQMIVTTSSGSSTAVDYAKTSSVAAVSEATTVHQIVAYFNVTSSTTYYLTGYQNCGASCTAYPRYAAVRLGAGSI